jgi:hypothetical protein
LNLFRDERTDSAELGQWPILNDEIAHLLRPQKRAARSATKGAGKNSRLAFRLVSEQLRNIGV